MTETEKLADYLARLRGKVRSPEVFASSHDGWIVLSLLGDGLVAGVQLTPSQALRLAVDLLGLALGKGRPDGGTPPAPPE